MRLRSSGGSFAKGELSILLQMLLLLSVGKVYWKLSRYCLVFWSSCYLWLHVAIDVGWSPSAVVLGSSQETW